MSRFRGKIAILKGGYSDEREISLKTAENVEKALEELCFNFVSIPCAATLGPPRSSKP